jgi:hypothetical protein
MSTPKVVETSEKLKASAVHIKDSAAQAAVIAYAPG